MAVRSHARGSVSDRVRTLSNSPVVLRLGAFAVFAVIWEAYATASDSLLLPTFTETMSALVYGLMDPVTWQAFAASNVAMVIGFAMALLTGIPLGLLMGRFRTADRAFNPYLVIVLAVPLAGIIPLLTMTVGLGLAARSIVVWSFAIVMVAETCRVGVRSVDRSLIEMARVFGVGELGLWRRVLIPAAQPAIFSGVRIGLARAIEGMVIVELIMVAAGIGGLILRYQAFFNGAALYAVVLLVIAESLILLSLVDRLSTRLTPWVGSESIVLR